MNLKKIFGDQERRIKDSSNGNYSYDVYCDDELMDYFLSELDAKSYATNLSNKNSSSNVAVVFITFDDEGYITSEETLWKNVQ